MGQTLDFNELGVRVTVEKIDQADPGFPEDSLFVSSSEGDDKNPGTLEMPIKTVARMREVVDGRDAVFFKRGDRWNEQIGNWKWSNMIVGAYGEGPRPFFDTGDKSFIRQIGDLKNVTFKDLEATPSTYTGEGSPRGVAVQGSCENITFKNMRLYGFNTNISLIGLRGLVRNITVDGCKLERAFSLDAHGQGLYASKMSDLTVKDSIFFENSIDNVNKFQHSMYIQRTVEGFTCTGNVIVGGSGNAIQARNGGWIRNNLVANNRNGILMGGDQDEVDVGSAVKRNLIFSQDFGIATVNPNPKTELSFNAIHVNKRAIGINSLDFPVSDLIIRNNNISGNICINLVGQNIEKTLIKENRFWHTGFAIQFFMSAPNLVDVQFDSNDYEDKGDLVKWFSDESSGTMDYASWEMTDEPTATVHKDDLFTPSLATLNEMIRMGKTAPEILEEYQDYFIA